MKLQIRTGSRVVHKPSGRLGWIHYVRFAPPTYTEPDVYSVRFDDRLKDPSYRGTIVHAKEVELADGEDSSGPKTVRSPRAREASSMNESSRLMTPVRALASSSVIDARRGGSVIQTSVSFCLRRRDQSTLGIDQLVKA